MQNAMFVLKSGSCSNREWYAGKCAGLEEIIRIKERYIDYKIKER
jgi:hypothetical protein